MWQKAAWQFEKAKSAHYYRRVVNNEGRLRELIFCRGQGVFSVALVQKCLLPREVCVLGTFKAT